jgi:hypothetical protein
MFGAVMRARFPMATQQPAPTCVSAKWEPGSRRKCDQASDNKAFSASAETEVVVAGPFRQLEQ